MKTLHLSIITILVISFVIGISTAYVLSINSTNSSDPSFLDLSVSTNSTFLKTGQTIGIDITLNNTSSKTLTINHQNMWKLKGIGLHPCNSETPFGIAILEGNYVNDNMTEAKQLSLYSNGLYSCPSPFIITSYVFQPLSDNASIVAFESPNYYKSTDHFSLRGYFVDRQFLLFHSGQYTIVGGDEWGHVVIRHFVVSTIGTIGIANTSPDLKSETISNSVTRDITTLEDQLGNSTKTKLVHDGAILILNQTIQK